MKLPALLMITAVALGTALPASALAHRDHGREHAPGPRHHAVERHHHRHGVKRRHYRPRYRHWHRHPHRYPGRYWRPHHDSWYGIHLFFGGY